MKTKIALYDSGLGGLSILGRLVEKDLGVDYLYWADREYLPLGSRSGEFIRERLERVTLKLQQWGAQVLILACNTATAQAIDFLRQRFRIPIIGVEPYINAINNNPDIKKWFALMTPQTAQSSRFEYLQEKLDPQKKITVIPCPDLAMMIENEWENTKALENYIIHHLKPLLPEHTESTGAILGCTHYRFISSLLEKNLLVKTFSTEEAIAKRLDDLGLIQTSDDKDDRISLRVPLIYAQNYQHAFKKLIPLKNSIHLFSDDEINGG